MGGAPQRGRLRKAWVQLPPPPYLIALALLLAASCCPPRTRSDAGSYPAVDFSACYVRSEHALADAATALEPVPPECQPSFPRDCNFARTINGTNYCCGQDATQAPRGVAARRD